MKLQCFSKLYMQCVTYTALSIVPNILPYTHFRITVSVKLFSIIVSIFSRCYKLDDWIDKTVIS